ncbi:MAG: hypothetical protein ACI38O_08170 [Fibrobacter intestinalis]|uniref:hypothetical protein n=1 Tax=Fibrobacter intestinalis TaxID=28122 RepID=UPI003F0E26C0
MKKILIYPDPKLLEGNFYLSHIANILANKYNILDSSKQYTTSLLSCDFILLNWFESIGNKPLLLLKRLLFLLIALCTRKKIIWTIHNKMPHEGICFCSKIIIFLLLRVSWKIHILCRESYKISFLKKFVEKCVLIPHGDYFGDFKSSGINLYGKYKIDPKSKIILFSGAVKPYKNIDLLIQAYSDSCLADNGFTLLIRGVCYDKKFLNKIVDIQKHTKGVIFDPTFIPVCEMYDYLIQSICLVAPYDKNSTLNSGTLWMALSYKRTMIIPQIGSVLDIQNADSFLYSYSYETAEDHKVKLREMFQRLKDDVGEFKDCLQKKGELGYKYMKQKSWENQKEKWIDLFV